MTTIIHDLCKLKSHAFALPSCGCDKNYDRLSFRYELVFFDIKIDAVYINRTKMNRILFVTTSLDDQSIKWLLFIFLRAFLHAFVLLKDKKL